MVAGQLGQLAWLTAGSRTMTQGQFGSVLAAQALYGLLQFLVDNGPGFYGARLAGSGALDQPARGSIVRMRLQLAAPAVAVSLVVGAVGGSTSFVATAPFAAALVFWALFSYWEPYGRGRSGPFSTYLILRSFIPAGLAALCLASGLHFPVFLAGVAECSAIASVIVSFRLEAAQDLRRAVGARRGPWRSAMAIGIPTVISQIGLASGTVLLNMAGSRLSAAAMAIGMRLLTGTYGLAGVFATSLFPSLVREGRVPPRARAGERRSVVLSLAMLFVLTWTVSAVLISRSSLIVHVFLNRGDADAEATAILSVSTAAAFGYMLILSVFIIARHHEQDTVVPYLSGTALTLASSIAVVTTQLDNDARLMAGALAAGSSLSAFLLWRKTAALAREIRSPFLWGLLNVYLTIGAGVTAVLFPETRTALSVGALAAVVAVTAATLSRRHAFERHSR